MSRSPYAVTPASIVACPHCKMPMGKVCIRWCKKTKTMVETGRCHSARRRLADEQRTREVNSKLLPPLEHDYIPIREPLPQRIPDLCPDDSRDEVKP